MARRTNNAPTETQDEQGVLPMRAPHRQADRAGKRNIGGQIDVGMARALAILAAKEDRTQLSLLEEAITDLFKKHDHEIEAR